MTTTSKNPGGRAGQGFSAEMSESNGGRGRKGHLIGNNEVAGQDYAVIFDRVARNGSRSRERMRRPAEMITWGFPRNTPDQRKKVHETLQIFTGDQH